MCRSAARMARHGLPSVLGLLIVLAGTAVVAPPSQAWPESRDQPAVRTQVGPRAHAPAQVRAGAGRAPSLRRSARNLGTVLLSGRTAKSQARVVLQRRTTRGTWVRVTRLTSRRHQFRTVVRKTKRTVAYRVVDTSSGRRSRVRTVPRLTVTRDACGVRPLKPNGEPWRCSFHDDFSGTVLDPAKWTVQKDGFITGDPPGAAACYSGENVKVANGTLRLVARRATLWECPGLIGITKLYTSGMVSTHDQWSQRYGRFEARIHSPAETAQGLHEAYWLWPANPTATNIDEIDIAETYSRYPDIAVPFLHYGDNASRTNGPHQTTAYHCTAARGGWNTYRMEWSATRIRIWVNDRLCLSNRSGDAAFRKDFIMILTQALGAGTNGVNLLDPPRFPATMKVDYARVWK